MPEINPIEGLKALSEANPDSLSEFFNRDPMVLSPADITRLVSEYRKLRARWAVAELAGKKQMPKALKEKAVPVPAGPAAPTDMEF